MADSEVPLDSEAVARFVAAGFLRLDGIVPDDLNAATMRQFHDQRPQPATGTPLFDAYPDGYAVKEMLELASVRGAIRSLVGPDPTFHNHDIHIRESGQDRAQPLHADQIVEGRTSREPHAFDLTLMYYPHEITLDMGGTLIVPGSHLRRINGSDVGRYQNVRGQLRLTCPAGTVLLLHQGIWHCGRRNVSGHPRYMFRVRIHPVARQTRQWDVDAYDTPQIRQILTQRFDWYEQAAARLDMAKRVELWRYLTGDDSYAS